MTVGYLLDHISFDELVPHLLPMIWEPESLLYYMREELMGDLLLYTRAQLPLYPKWNRGKFKEDVEEYCSFALITHV